MIFTSEKQLKEYGDKIPADKKAAIETALTELKEAHKAKDTGKIETALATINTAWQAASQDMYQATQGAEQGQPTENGAPADDASATDEVTDVDFEEVNETESKGK